MINRFLKIVFASIAVLLNTPQLVIANSLHYQIEGVFYEPMTQNSGGNTVFTGEFDWDGQLKTMSNLHGVMNSSMFSAVQDITLDYFLAFNIDNTGIATAAVFKENSLDVFNGGGYAKGDYWRYGQFDGNVPNENAYFAFSFDTASMSALTNSIEYADCTKNGMMGPSCMTGHSLGGTMNATPLSLTITAVPVPAAFWLLGSSLLALLGFGRRTVKAA